VSTIRVAVWPESGFVHDLARSLLASMGFAIVPSDTADVTVVVTDHLAASGLADRGNGPMVLLRDAGADNRPARFTPTATVSWEDEPAKLRRAIEDTASGRRTPISLIPAPRQEDAVAALTPRERHILAIVARGGTNPQIADELDISVHTVRTHMRNIFEKLGVAHRHAAGVLGLRSSLLEQFVTGDERTDLALQEQHP
jgi:DNA-binding CsgD family transcriptional regulator